MHHSVRFYSECEAKKVGLELLSVSNCDFNSAEWVLAHLKARVRCRMLQVPLKEIYSVTGQQWRDIVKDEFAEMVTEDKVRRLLRANHRDVVRKLRFGFVKRIPTTLNHNPGRYAMLRDDIDRYSLLQRHLNLM